MPYHDSPGWERQWADYPWDWDFHVSTVSEGHRVVGETDKKSAKEVGAKLTFGEVLDCGVSLMLSNLGAKHKRSFHDLGCGPGKMLIQAYLQYPNFSRCMGVELAKGRYDLAEKNVRTLLRVGWRGRKFLGIELKKNAYFSIVEDVPNKTPNNGWQIGDACMAYSIFLRKSKDVQKDYSGVITEVKLSANGDASKNIYAVKYTDGTECQRIKHQHLFIPGTERVLEVWYGSLFDYPGGFDADMCILETDFPAHMHPNLIKCMCTTPMGCTFLTYHDLKKFPCFDWQQLRQIDRNIYDNDRYITSWSQGWRFSIWEHIDNSTVQKALPEHTHWKIGDAIIFESADDSLQIKTPEYGEIMDIKTKITNTDPNTNTNTDEQKADTNTNTNTNTGANANANANAAEVELVIKTNRIHGRKVFVETRTISSAEYRIAQSTHLFRINEHVSCYLPESVVDLKYDHRFDIFKGRVLGVNADALTYVVQYLKSNDVRVDVPQMYLNRACKLLFAVGTKVMACWPRNAQNKNCIHRYKKFPATVVGINNSSTYRCKFDVNPYLTSLLKPKVYPEDYTVPDESSKRSSAYAPTKQSYYAETVREMWVTYPSQFALSEYQVHESEAEQALPLPLQLLDQKQTLKQNLPRVPVVPSAATKNFENVKSWTRQEILRWLLDIGFGAHLKLHAMIADSSVRLTGSRLLTIQSKTAADFVAEFCQLLQINAAEVTAHAPVFTLADVGGASMAEASDNDLDSKEVEADAIDDHNSNSNHHSNDNNTGHASAHDSNAVADEDEDQNDFSSILTVDENLMAEIELKSRKRADDETAFSANALGLNQLQVRSLLSNINYLKQVFDGGTGTGTGSKSAHVHGPQCSHGHGHEQGMPADFVNQLRNAFGSGANMINNNNNNNNAAANLVAEQDQERKED